MNDDNADCAIIIHMSRRYDEVHIPAPKMPEFAATERLIPIKDLPEWTHPAFAGMEKLNRIQSRVCEKVNCIFYMLQLRSCSYVCVSIRELHAFMVYFVWICLILRSFNNRCDMMYRPSTEAIICCCALQLVRGRRIARC